MIEREILLVGSIVGGLQFIAACCSVPERAALAVKVNTTKMMMMLCGGGGGGVCVLRATLIAFDSANWIIRYLGRPQQQQQQRACPNYKTPHLAALPRPTPSLPS